MRTETSQVNRLQQIMTDRINHMRKHLALMLHAKKYQNVTETAHADCRVPFCQSGRKLWHHIVKCTGTPEADSCTEPYCRVSREMLKHWELCSKAQKLCPMCSPLRMPKRRQPQSNKLQAPNCRTSRETIRHYKDCNATNDCEMCKIPNYLKRKANGIRRLAKKRHSTLLKHSCCCRDKTCKNPMCIKMKRALTHTNVCQTMCSDSMLCREIVMFCLHHAISCTEKNCILLDEMPGADKLM